MFKKALVVGIIFLFIGVSVQPVFALNIKNSLSNEPTVEEKTIAPISRGETLYVDDDFDESTPGWNDTHFDKIQKGINAANDGDTIKVFSGSYYERPRIHKQLFMKGIKVNDEDNPIIIGGKDNNTVVIYADGCLFEDFRVKNGPGGYLQDGIILFSDYNIIRNCYSFETGTGLVLSSSNNNVISNNKMWGGWNGIKVSGSSYNTFFNNNVHSHNEHEIQVYGSNNRFFDNTVSSCKTGNGFLVSASNNLFSGNIIKSNKRKGIQLISGKSNTIKGNIISNKEYGIYLYDSCGNTIYHNNFIDNGENAYDKGDNIWDDGYFSGGNYWDDYEEKYPDAKPLLLKPWIWDTPYEIPGGDNKDMYPLVNQWPKSKPRTISRNTASYSSYLLRFLEQFPILQKILLLQRLGLQ